MSCDNEKFKCANCINDACHCDGVKLCDCMPKETSCCCNK